MDQFIEDVKHFSKYSSSTMFNVNFAIVKQIYSYYSNNLHYMRGAFMMNMFISQQNTDFFDIPSAPSLFQSVYMKVSSTLVNYPAMFIQGLAAKIQNIYESPMEFAAAVDLFFQEDITDVIVFAYSTFPAIYSFFLTEEFCSSASSFLTAIFKSSKNQLLSELLLSSFFISGTVFYDHFFSLIGDHLFELTSKKNDFLLLSNHNDDNQNNNKRINIFKKLFEPKSKANRDNEKSNNNNNQKFQTSINNFFPIFIRSLTTCLPLLSQYHIQAYKNFSKTFPQSSHKFFLQKVLLHPFQTAAESSIGLVSSEGNRFFIAFLNVLSDYPKDNPLIKSLLSTIIDSFSSEDDENNNNNNNNDDDDNENDNRNHNLIFHEVYPTLKGFVWNHGVPVLLSHIDIKLFVNILSFPENDLFGMRNSNFSKLKVKFRDSFDTISFNVFPHFCGMNGPERGIGVELFGEMPPTLEISINKYKNLIDEQKLKGESDDNIDETEEDENDLYEIEKAALINSSKKRIFRKIINFAQEESLDLTELVLNPPNEFAMLKGDISYIFLLLNKFHSNFTTVEQTILMEEAKKKIKILIMSTRELIHITYHHFSFSFLKERIHKISDVVPAIRELINSDSDSDTSSKSGSNSNLNLRQSSSSIADSDLLLAKGKVNTAFLSTDELPFQKPSENRLLNSVIYEISLTALDALKLREGTIKIEAAEADFEDELMMWIEDSWPEFKEREIFQKRMKNIENLSKFLKHVQKGGYGRRLKIIINFVRSLKLILTSDNFDLWKPAFKYAVFCSSQKQIFSTFLYIHHFIVMQMRLDEIWSSEIRNFVSMFTAGMWSILDNNVELNVKYANYETAKQIFYS